MMSQGIENKIISRIYGRGRGWAFTKTDFVAEFGEANIHQALSSLTKAGKIRRVCRGVYDYPRYSELLDRHGAGSGGVGIRGRVVVIDQVLVEVWQRRGKNSSQNL